MSLNRANNKNKVTFYSKFIDKENNRYKGGKIQLKMLLQV